MSFLKRLRENVSKKTESVTQKFISGLSKTSHSFVGAMNNLFTGRTKIDEDLYEELEDILIGADVGVNTTLELVERLRDEVKERKIKDPSELQPLLSEIIGDMLTNEDESHHIQLNEDGLTVILFVGVNGVGKTTSIGKLAHRYKSEGKKVVMAAGDTFRAGAIEQLQVWGERVGVDVIRQSSGSDPAAVIYDGIQAAKSRQADILLCDTAGRLQNKVNLMEELKKVNRVIQREVPDGPHEILLALDATAGQNALVQAKQFGEAVNVSGIVLTKLDGTAKGGIVIAISHELNIPVKLVGLGEKADDLQTFDTDQFLHALFKDAVIEDDKMQVD
ncbi:signal recognition particle-docking protein FtsY [Hazenella sp. IB182357]|uniref:Signal recognition particle receptor FtsY n=1 Tax=Polycladospora coralii TaxID=2771432 RepID=A0A926NDF3_9BACL|nr:signal recognition particle-docking protein FtsY [Polycladospora coralii]MBD1371418.1 signal recognition particle-docking protein FtsY [Polycladospora coralii]MBS7530386.1 signal recognition particle-docking protein FtsY [Polycladospora coralii]